MIVFQQAKSSEKVVVYLFMKYNTVMKNIMAKCKFESDEQKEKT